MVNLKNGLIFYLLFHLFKHSITRLESITIVRIMPGHEGLLNCSESSSIMLGNVSVQNIGHCENIQTECDLNMNDHELIKECDGSSSCHLNGSLLTSACLWKDLHFNMSYTCNVPYVYVGCYVDNTARVLDDDHKKNPEMSADICHKICTKSEKWKEGDNFGTQYAEECFCGDGKQLGVNPYFEKNISECNHSCLGHKDEKCGGDYRMSVYQITKPGYNNYTCLDMDQKHAIKDCATNHLQTDSLCIKFDASSESHNQRCSSIGDNLYDFCRREHPNRKCVFNMKNVLKATNEKQPSRSISIEYLCKERVSSPTESSLTTGTVVGSVVGCVLFLCLVCIGIFIGRRFVFFDKSNEKLRNNPETNDYIGNQNIALPQAVSPAIRNIQYEDLQNTSGNKSTHNYSSTNIHLQNINDKYGYAKNIKTNKSKTFNDTTSTPTYVVLRTDSYNPNMDANNDEYSVVDPTAESSFNQSQQTTTQRPENYMILDPSETGINRSKFQNTDQTYELAKPFNDTRGHKDDTYALSPEGTYDHSGITRHRKDQDTIYTHAVDNVYDSASRGVNIVGKEDTYDHFFGQKTEDEYNISMH